MFQLQPASGRKTLHRLWGRGTGPGPSQNSLSNKGLIQGCGAELGCSETHYSSSSGSACPEGADGAVGGSGRGLPDAGGGQGAAVGTLLCAGRLRRAPLAAHCGCDVSMEGRSRRTAAPQLPPAQAVPGEGSCRPGGGLGAVLLPLHKTFLIFKPAAGQSAHTGKREARSPVFPFPVFSSRSLALSTTACTCPKYHCSHLQRGQLRNQPLFHRGTGQRCSDMPSRAPGQGRVALGCSCCSRQPEHSPVAAPLLPEWTLLAPRSGFLWHHPHSTAIGPVRRIGAASHRHPLAKGLEHQSLPSSRGGKKGSSTSGRRAALAGLS